MQNNEQAVLELAEEHGTSGVRARVDGIIDWDDELPTLASKGNSNFGNLRTLRSIDPSDVGAHELAKSTDGRAEDSRFGSRRKDERQPVQLEVEFDYETQFYAGLTQDISTGGIFIATYRVHPIGTPISLSFELPDGTKITAGGEVRWIRETLTSSPGMGVAFTDISETALSAIADFCNQSGLLYVEI